MSLLLKIQAAIAAFLMAALTLAAEDSTGLVDGEWYIRLIAESAEENLTDKSNVLGQLNISQRGKDRHDLETLSPLATQYLSLVFPHPEWGDQAGDYGSDYHAMSGSEGDEWDFVVRSDDPDRSVTLSWDATHENPLNRSYLIDVDEGKRINAMRDGSTAGYTFSMGGVNERNFRWVLNRDTGQTSSSPTRLQSY